MKFNLSTCFILLTLQCFFFSAYAQKTAKLYRGVTLIGTYSTIDSALKNATNIGDSILLSADTFKEFLLQIPGGIVIQGTMSSKDSTIVDAEYKGVIGKQDLTVIRKNRAVKIRDVILQNGKGGLNLADTLMLKGYTIIRYCTNTAVVYAFLYDHAKLTHNTADSFGGGGCFVWAYDSSEICYNTARYGGGVGYLGAGGTFYCNSPGVRVHHNIATMGGGGIYGHGEMTAGQITDNQAPLGAAWWSHVCLNSYIQNCYIYNPTLAGKRQNEVYVRSGFFNMEGSWFGKSDTIGLIKVGPTPCDPLNAVRGKYAKANWSINKGKSITNKDTLFPIGAGFTYSDGSPLPANALPWLQGKFSSSTGKMLTPNPRVSATDTMSSLFRTYVYANKGDTTSKPINFVCIVDADTFRTSPRVWGIDSIKLSIGNKTLTTLVRVYPNPTTDFIHIEGLETGTSIELYDLSGRLVKNEKLINGFGATLVSSTYAQPDKAVVDVKNLSTGTYLLKISTKEGAVGTAKVLKE